MKNSIKIETLSYPVFLSHANWEELASFLHGSLSKGRLFVVMDENTHMHCYPLLAEHFPSIHQMPLFVFAAGEAEKNVGTMAALWDRMMKTGINKKDVLLNLGGGVVTDLGGFAAATFKRGVNFVNIPTTLIGQADAATGGKTGINFNDVKNLIGVFHDPLAVFIMTDFLKTLPFRHLRSGMAEIIKCSFLEGKGSWERLQSLAQNWQENVLDLVQDSVNFKCQVVASDPFDRNRRQMLNFGHTIGHGLEGIQSRPGSKTRLHGEAVAAGLICESFLAKELGLMNTTHLKSITEVVMSVFDLSPVDPGDIDKVTQRMNADKKNDNRRINFSLAHGPGKPALNIAADQSDIMKAFTYYNNLFSS